MSNPHKIHYQIEFFSDWHTGSGLAVAGDADAAVLKDENGLPYIPGKTLKGLLRHAAQTLLDFGYNGINEAFIKKAFGQKTNPDLDVNVPMSATRACFFSDAELSASVRANLDKAARPYLYSKIASTAIDPETGTAKSQSLRKMEVTVPMVLSASISGVEPEDKALWEAVLAMVKRLGTGRHRGLGRCQFSMI